MLVEKNTKSTPSCNCRKKDDCPMNRNSLINNAIDKCIVLPTATRKQQAYIGLTETVILQPYAIFYKRKT